MEIFESFSSIFFCYCCFVLVVFVMVMYAVCPIKCLPVRATESVRKYERTKLKEIFVLFEMTSSFRIFNRFGQYYYVSLPMILHSFYLILWSELSKVFYFSDCVESFQQLLTLHN